MPDKLKILCIDDSADFLVLLSFWLTTKNYEPITALNAFHGIDFIKRGQADIVLVDYKMPGMDGIAAIKEIRSISPTLPIIIMTAHADDELVNKLRGLSVTGFMSKLESFESELESILNLVGRDLKR